MMIQNLVVALEKGAGTDSVAAEMKRTGRLMFGAPRIGCAKVWATTSEFPLAFQVLVKKKKSLNIKWAPKQSPFPWCLAVEKTLSQRSPKRT